MIGRATARVKGLTAEQWCTFVVVVGALVFLVSQLHPRLIVTNTTPTGGDTGAHVFAPAYLRDHLLHEGRLSGWSPGWYAGFPLFVFYPVVPMLLIVVLGAVIPFGIAMKLVTTLGIVSLPIAAWACGRLSGLSFPTPAVLAASTIPFLFDQSFSIWGGNIQSTLAGEFSFSIALSLAVLAIGLVARLLRTGRGLAWAAFVLGLTWVCHPIVAFYAAVGVGTVTLAHLGWRRLRDAALVVAVAALLASFWVLPFLLRRHYMSSMGFSPLPDPGRSSWSYLAPHHLRWVLGVAAVGLAASVLRRNRLGLSLAANVVIFAVLFPHFPRSIGLWNARLLPFYFLCVYLLAGIGAVALARIVAWLLGRLDPEVRRWSLVGAPPAVLLFVVVLVGLPLHALPGGSLMASSYSWFGLSTTETSVVPGWTALNYGGYERQAAWPEYHGIMTTMSRVGADHGCGRADYEYDASLGRYGTPLAMMLLPYWTHGCVDSMEGLYFESSGTTPYHFLTAAEISEHPSNPMAGLTYPSFDVAAGVTHMQLEGVRYYLAFSPAAIHAAARQPALREVATSGPWHVFEIAGSDLVAPLQNRPAVATGVGGAWTHWRDAAAPWFLKYPGDPSEPVLTAAGPGGWQRVAADTNPQRVSLPAVTVSDVRADDDSVAFHVDRVGVPVLVKVSYFPNWTVSGAEGPFRATPNFMVVVPTAPDVRLSYGSTWVDWVSQALSVLGVVGLVVLFVYGRRRADRPVLVAEASTSWRPRRAALARPGRRPATGGRHRLAPQPPAEPEQPGDGAGDPLED